MIRQKKMIAVAGMLMAGTLVGTLALLNKAAHAEAYTSPAKSPTGVVAPRDSYYPGTEELSPDEMRIISCGTGMPAARRGQAATLCRINGT